MLGAEDRTGRPPEDPSSFKKNYYTFLMKDSADPNSGKFSYFHSLIPYNLSRFCSFLMSSFFPKSIYLTAVRKTCCKRKKGTIEPFQRESNLLFLDPPAFPFSHEDECIPYEIHPNLLSNKTKHHIRTRAPKFGKTWLVGAGSIKSKIREYFLSSLKITHKRDWVL